MDRFFLVVTSVACLTFTVEAQRRSVSVIEPERLTGHVRVLASDAFEGRAPASAGEEKTVAYLVSQFTELGLQPGGDPDGRGGRAWTQDVPLAQAETVGPVTSSFRTGGMEQALRQGEDIAVRATHLSTARVSLATARWCLSALA